MTAYSKDTPALLCLALAAAMIAAWVQIVARVM
jgi:hypothetical protein